MNCFSSPALLAATAFFLLTLPVKADTTQARLSQNQLDQLDKSGYFSPNFKTAVHALIDTKEVLEKARADVKAFSNEVPDLQKKSTDAQAQTAALRRELAGYQHPENEDFTSLQALMKDPSAKPEDQLCLAQAFVWAYPSNPHADEARQDLLDIQKKMADQKQAAKDAAEARAAAQAKLLQRVQARDLSLDEWKDFLRDKSQEEVLKYLGRPDVAQAEYWTYDSAFTIDPATGKKTGLLVSFNGTRVNSVAEGPNAP